MKTPLDIPVHHILDIEILGNEANIIIQYYLVPCRLSSDPKIHDLNDLDGLFGVKFCFRAVLAG